MARHDDPRQKRIAALEAANARLRAAAQAVLSEATKRCGHPAWTVYEITVDAGDDDPVEALRAALGEEGDAPNLAREAPAGDGMDWLTQIADKQKGGVR